MPVGQMSAGVVDLARGRVVARDLAAEERLLRRLDEIGLHRLPDYVHDELNANTSFPPSRLSHVVEALTADDWLVEAEGHLFRRPSDYRGSLSGGTDWFELEAEIDYGDQTARLPELLAALRKGEKYVQLSDCSRGMLPDQWLERFQTLGELGEREDGKLRFQPSQGMLLDALLDAADNIQIDEHFAEFREKLRSFRGVAPADPPPEFQGQLRPYQREGLGWLHFLREYRLGGCLADDMGLGKTVQVLALLESRRRHFAESDEEHRPSLVVVPRSLIFNWIDEAARFAPQLRLLNYTGALRKFEFDNIPQYDVIVTTYGTLRRDAAKLKDVEFDYAILDESQAIKNAQSQAAKACRLLRASHRLAMTGTPVENHLGELWSLFEFLNPGMLGRGEAFKRMTAASTDGDKSSLERLARGLAPFMLRRTKEKVLDDLPPKTEQTLYCELGTKQRKLYNELRDHYRRQLTEKIDSVGLKRSKIHVLEALLRLRQAACHPALLDAKQKKNASAKFECLFEQLPEVTSEGHKALVFSQFTSLLGLARKELDKLGVRYEYLDGRTRKRKEKVQRFQDDPDCPLFLISLKAGGHGLNLTAADYIYILDPWWNPAVEAQAVDRAHRIGQSRKVFAYRLIARDTVEEKIVQLQQSKRELAEAIVSEDKNFLAKLTADDLQLLLS
jgi:SNF2 family DNA or RNA helicase